MTLPHNDNDNDELFDEYTSLEDLLGGDWLAPRLDLSNPRNPANGSKIHFYTEENPLSVCGHRTSSHRYLRYEYDQQTLEGESAPDPRGLCAMCTQIRFHNRAQPKVAQVKAAHRDGSILTLPGEMVPTPRAAVDAVFDRENHPVASFVVTRFHGVQDGIARFSVDCDLDRTYRLNRTMQLALQDFNGLVEFLVPDEDTSAELVARALAETTPMTKQRRKLAKKYAKTDPIFQPDWYKAEVAAAEKAHSVDKPLP